LQEKGTKSTITAQKDRIEKWITNVLDGDSYSKIKKIVKENVKAVLSDNKILISTAFAAIIQMLKSDPELVNVIHKIPTTNNSEQRKYNDINITKYLECNKDNLLDLAEKHYENLVEAMTNNVIDSAAASCSSNPTLSLPQSSSSLTFNL
jgi:hypothetical protein